MRGRCLKFHSVLTVLSIYMFSLDSVRKEIRGMLKKKIPRLWKSGFPKIVRAGTYAPFNSQRSLIPSCQRFFKLSPFPKPCS